MYQGFLIAGYNTGFHTTKAPWMAPQDAFVTLENARCQDGILSKRAGSAHIAQMVHVTTPAATSIVGLHQHTSMGITWLIACDTTHCNVYDPDSGIMVEASDGAIFSGTASDMFWFQQIDGKTYMTNGVNGVYYFNGDTYDPDDGTDVTALTLNNGSGTFTGVKMLFYLNDRLLCYDIVDQTYHKPYRCRYSQTLARGNTPVFTDGGYLDVPTDDTPVTGRRLGRYVYIWYQNSLWSIGPSGDTDTPFVPQIIRGDLGSMSRGVCIPFNKGLLTVGNKDLVFFDGYETKMLNLPNLNNILTQFSWAALKYSWGTYDECAQRIYITFAATGSTYPDRILEYCITEGLWAVHKLPVHSMAIFNTLAGTERSYPVIGGRDGWVSRLFTDTSDNDVAFAFTAKSGRFNPFLKQGKRVALGRVAVLVDVDAAASFTISLFKNTSSTAYRTQNVSCAGSGDKVWVTMHAGGEIGDFHQIQFGNTLIDNSPVIHATWLEMEAAGSIDP